MASVRVDLSAGPVVEKNLFGHNLEHSRSAVFQGLSAQLLRNRKFAGKPAAHFGQAAEWRRIGPENVFVSMDPKDAYVRHERTTGRSLYDTANEINSQVIQNPIDGQIAGIGQRGLALEDGRTYIAKAVLKGRGELSFEVTLRITGDTGKVLGEKTFAVNSSSDGEDWRCYEFTFRVSGDNGNAAFEIVFNRRAEIKVGAASLLPAETFRGMRSDVVALMKDLGITLLRWPGGNFSGEYNWKDGLLDVDMRAPQLSYQPVETQPHSNGYDYHEIGIDDFIALCREIGAEPYLTINLAWDSPEESAQWVEYCNGGSDTEWGKKRRDRGFAEPYKVHYWSLGNEFGHGHMEGLNTPEAYAEKALLSAAAMKKVDPGIVFFSSGPYTPERDPEPWTRKGLPLLAKEISYVSYHAYQWLFVHGMDFVTDRGLRQSYETVIDAPRLWLEKLTRFRSILDRNIAISFDEWNVFFAWYHNPCVIEGIFTALMLEMICREHSALNMPICMYFQPVNEGAILVYPFTSELTANGQVFSLMKKHAGASLLKVDTGDGELHGLGTLDKQKRSITVTLINKSYDREIPFTLDSNLEAPAKVTLLDGKGSLLHGSRFIITEISVEKVKDTFTVPPHSILQLEFQGS